MVDGRIRQEGPVQEVFRHPADAQVAESVGMENVLPAEAVDREGGLVTLRVGAARLQCLDTEARPTWACISAEEVEQARETAEVSSVRNRLAGRVQSVLLEGPLARGGLDCGFPLGAALTAPLAGG